jgi:hypothetical protein
VEGIHGRLDEEDAEVGVRAQESVDQVLVATPHCVPRLEGEHDEVRHRTLR